MTARRELAPNVRRRARPAAPGARPAHQRTLANSALAFASRAVSGLALVGAQALFARTLSPGETGLYHLAAFVGTLAATIGTLGLPSAATRFVAAEVGRGAGGAPAVARHILAAAASGLAGALALLAAATSLGPAAWRPAAPAALVLYAGATGARLVLAALTQGFADFRGQLVAGLLPALLLLSGAAWLHLRGGDATLALLVTAAPAALAAALLAWRARPRLALAPGAPPLDAAARARVRAYALGVSAMLLLDVVVWQQSELVFLRALSPVAEGGLYAVSFALTTQAMQLLPGSVAVALFPALSHAAGDGNRAALVRAYRGALRLLAVAAVPAGLVGAALAPALLRALYGAAFDGAAPAARVLWISAAVGSLGAAPASILYALERQRTMVLASLPVAALNVALDLLLIPRHGALGAAIANAAAQVTGVAVGVFLARRDVGPPPWGRLARIAGASGCIAALAWLAAAGRQDVVGLLRGGLVAAALTLALVAASRDLRQEASDLVAARRRGEGGASA